MLVLLCLVNHSVTQEDVKGIKLEYYVICNSISCRFLKSAAAQEACDHLTKVLGKSPLILTELDLSEDKLGDLDGEKLSALLMDSHSKVEKIK